MKYLICFSLFALSITSFSQQRVALQSTGVTTIFGGANPFLDAYNAASSGDTIYLPGGNIPFPSTIDKGITVLGAGHYPDSTLVTNPTILTGNIYLGENADGAHLEGFLISGGLLTDYNAKVDEVKIKRMRIGYINFQGINQTNPGVNIEIIESVIDGDISFTNINSSLVSNCIIAGRLINGVEIGIRNNILLYNSGSTSSAAYVLNNMDNCFISNNVFFRETYPNNVFINSELNTLTKNVFRGNPIAGTNTLFDNYTDVDLTSFFQNVNQFSFDYNQDYHLTDPISFLGTDGNELGVYGGFFPYKEGAVPMNPHFQYKAIAGQTDNNGMLQIEITIESQNH